MVSLTLIAALDEDRGIGKNGSIPWYIPADFKRFKQKTLGHACIMGRKTYLSIIERISKPLPGRISVVLTHDTAWQPEPGTEGVYVAHTVEEAICIAHEVLPDADTVYSIGGAEIYRQTLPLATALDLTLVVGTHGCDTFFPDFSHDFSPVSRETIEGAECVYFTRNSV